jgi:hypothetical protein
LAGLTLSDLTLLHQVQSQLKTSKQTLAEIANELQISKQVLYKRLRKLGKLIGAHEGIISTIRGVGTKVPKSEKASQVFDVIGEILNACQKLTIPGSEKAPMDFHVGISRLLAQRFMPWFELAFHADDEVLKWKERYDRDIALRVEIDEPYRLIDRSRQSPTFDLIVCGSAPAGKKLQNQVGNSVPLHTCLIMRREHELAEPQRKANLSKEIKWKQLAEYELVLLDDRRLMPDPCFPWQKIDEDCKGAKRKLVNTYLEAHGYIMSDPYVIKDPPNSGEVRPRKVAVTSREFLTREEEEAFCVIELQANKELHHKEVVVLRPEGRYNSRSSSERQVVDALARIVEDDLKRRSADYNRARQVTLQLGEYRIAYHMSRETARKNDSLLTRSLKWYRDRLELEACADNAANEVGKATRKLCVKGTYDIEGKSRRFYLFGHLDELEKTDQYHLHWHEVSPGEAHALFSFVFRKEIFDSPQKPTEPILGFWLGLSSWGELAPYFGPVVLCTRESSEADLNKLVHRYVEANGMPYKLDELKRHTRSRPGPTSPKSPVHSR